MILRRDECMPCRRRRTFCLSWRIRGGGGGGKDDRTNLSRLFDTLVRWTACSAKANLKADREKERIWMFGVNLYTSSFSFSAFFLSLSFTLCHSSNWWARINISINGFFGLSLSHSLNHTTSLDCSRFLVSVIELCNSSAPHFLPCCTPPPSSFGLLSVWELRVWGFTVCLFFSFFLLTVYISHLHAALFFCFASFVGV